MSKKDRQELAQRMGITPLELLLSVMRDPRAKIAAKIDAAKAAAPYLHRRMPIALEGGDPDRPVTIDGALLVRLTTSEKMLLLTLLGKLGLDAAPAEQD